MPKIYGNEIRPGDVITHRLENGLRIMIAPLIANGARIVVSYVRRAE